MANSVHSLADAQKLKYSSYQNTGSTFDLKESINVIQKYTKRQIDIFLVDDDLIYLKALEQSISTHIPTVTLHSFETGEECLKQLKRKPAFIVLDFHLNSKIIDAMNGLEILKKIKIISPMTNVIILSSQENLDISLECIDYAYDYVKKNKMAFVRINKLITNELEDIEDNKSFYTMCKYIALMLFSTILLYLLLHM